MSKAAYFLESPSQQVEEIISLKVELAKSKAKLKEYDEIVIQNKQNQAHIVELNKLIGILSHRVEEYSKKIVELGRILNIQYEGCLTYPNNFYRFQNQSFANLTTPRWNSNLNSSDVKTYQGNMKESVNKSNSVKINIGQNTSKSDNFYQRQEKWNEQSQNLYSNKQQTILNVAIQKIIFLLRDNEQHLKKIDQLSSYNNKLRQIQELWSIQKQNIRQVEKISQEKQNQIKNILEQNKKLNQMVEGLGSQSKKILENHKQLKEKLERKNDEIQELTSQINQLEMYSNERKKNQIVSKCEDLINILEFKEEDYLKNYFSANGIKMQQFQKPKKSKYNLIFQNI